MLNISSQLKKTVKINFPNFIESYRVLRSNLTFTNKYWKTNLNKIYDSIDDLEFNPYEKVKLKKYKKK